MSCILRGGGVVTLVGDFERLGRLNSLNHLDNNKEKCEAMKKEQVLKRVISEEDFKEI